MKYSKTTSLLLVGLMLGVSPVRGEDTEPGGLPAPPRIVCDEPVYDFGKQDSGAMVKHTFVLRNEGGQPLVVSEVKAGCGCTAAKLLVKEIPPGGEADLECALSLVNRTGKQRKWIRVTSNDPLSPSISLWFEGTAFKGLQVQPDRLVFGRLSRQTEQAQTVAVHAATGEPLVVTGVETGSPYLEAEVVEETKGQDYSVRISTKAPAPEESQEVVVKLLTDSEKNPELSVPVKLYADLGEVMVVPDTISLPLSGGNQEVTRQFLVGAPGASAFRIERIDTGDPDVRYMIARMKPNQYRVQLSHIVPSEVFRGKSVLIRTDLPEKPSIIVPYVLED